jgi:hypothetical protein
MERQASSLTLIRLQKVVRSETEKGKHHCGFKFSSPLSCVIALKDVRTAIDTFCVIEGRRRTKKINTVLFALSIGRWLVVRAQKKVASVSDW